MAKNFSQAGSIKTFKEVAKASSEKAQIVTVKMIKNENLHNYKKNNEDLTNTIDLENSIKDLGFIDPIEITPFGNIEGHYTILSGHRRRAAGVKCNMNMFPCVIRNLNNQNDIENYVLLANSQRDSAKDPLLFPKRYKMHEQYLDSINFNGNYREEISKRLGVSKAQADRYNNMNKIILPVWDLIRQEIVGMSSVMPMASHNEKEQEEILDIINLAIHENIALTRENTKKIIDAYRLDIKNLDEIFNNYKKTEVLISNKSKQIIKEKNNKKDGNKILKQFNKLSNLLSNDYIITDEQSAKDIISASIEMCVTAIDEINKISKQNGMDYCLKNALEELNYKITNLN